MPRVDVAPLHHGTTADFVPPATTASQAPGAAIGTLAHNVEDEIEREAAVGFLGGRFGRFGGAAVGAHPEASVFGLGRGPHVGAGGGRGGLGGGAADAQSQNAQGQQGLFHIKRSNGK